MKLDANVRYLFQYSTSSFVKNWSRERRSTVYTAYSKCFLDVIHSSCGLGKIYKENSHKNILNGFELRENLHNESLSLRRGLNECLSLIYTLILLCGYISYKKSSHISVKKAASVV
jgi:hypothetical protein